jgi:hypothetical protein
VFRALTPRAVDLHDGQRSRRARDLPKDVHYYTPDEFDPEKPARTLIVVPVSEKPSPELLASRGWNPVKTVSEPTGQLVSVIYEKK